MNILNTRQRYISYIL